MRLAQPARHACAAALVTAATVLALAAAIGPLFYPQPRSGRWTLETQIRFFAPFFAPLAGASLADVLLGGGGRPVILTGAVATLGLVVGMQTRPWVLWAGTTAMARSNALWVAGAVFIGAFLGSLVAARRAAERPGREEGSNASAGTRGISHLAAFAIALLAAWSSSRHLVEAALLALAGAGAVLAVVGPYRRPGAAAVRLAGTAFLGWLAGVMWHEAAGR